MILYLGRINWKKGVERLIAALVQVPEAHLAVAGNDEERLLPGLVALAEKSGVAKRVTFLGPSRAQTRPPCCAAPRSWCYRRYQKISAM